MFQNAFFTVVAFWVSSEVGLLAFRRADAASSRQDAGSLRLLNVVIYTSVALGVYLGVSGIGHVHASNALLWFGLAVIVLGLALRWWAVLCLRRFFTVDVAVHPDQHLVRRGPYRFIRHPAYAGVLLSFFGLATCLSSWLSALVILLPIAGVFHHRIQVEEQVLKSAFPAEYPEYSALTSKLIPGIY